MSVALKQYAKCGAQGGIQDASPHRLIQLLYRGALDRMASAKGAIARGDLQGKAELIGKSIAIIGGLQDALSKEGGEITENLASLYTYVTDQLLKASYRNDEGTIDECIGLLEPVASAWDEIAFDAVPTAVGM